MMSAVFQKGLTVLMALLFASAVGWQSGSLLAVQPSPSSPPVCQCCNADGSNCATPTCCARPSNSRAPAAPVAPRGASGGERHAIVAGGEPLLAFQGLVIEQLRVRPYPIKAGAIPIFQRDCSLLI